MEDHEKSRDQLIAELTEIRQREALRESEARLQRAHDELERKVEERTAQLAKANEELAIFHKLAEASSQGFAISDLDGITRYVNPAMCRMLGEEGPESLVGKGYLSRYPPEVRKIVREQGLPATLQCGHWTGEMRMLTKHGTPIHTSHSTVLIRDDNDDPSRVAVVVTDVTERKRAEEALRESRDELQAIYEQAADGILIADAGRSGLVRVNAAYCRMLGYSEAEMMAISSEQVHPPEVMPRVWEHFKEVQRGNVARLESLPFLGRDGSLRYADVVSSPIYYNQRSCWISFFRDVTERKRAQEALQQSHDELRTIYDGMFEGLLILDLETKRLVRVNSSLCRMVGYTEEELLSMSVLDIHPPEDAAANLANIQARREGNLREDVNVRVLRKDGSTCFADIMGSGIIYGGRPCVLGLLRDITERKEAHAALERERQTLKHLLQSSDHERQLIAYEIHDGLAQYLAASVMQFEVHKHLKETKPGEAAKAYDAGMTMLRQSHADARRLISGVRPPILDEEGIVAALTHLVNEHRSEKGPRIEFRTKVAFNRLVPILENAIYRIAQEALTNARKYSASDRIQVELAQHGEDLRLKIQDWGIGFNPGEVEEDRFGLAGMRERARLLGGAIRVQSTPGKGTRISVKLPLMVEE